MNGAQRLFADKAARTEINSHDDRIATNETDIADMKDESREHGRRLNTLEAIVPAMNDALPTTYTLEADSNPAFTRVNSGAAER